MKGRRVCRQCTESAQAGKARRQLRKTYYRAASAAMLSFIVVTSVILWLMYR